MEESARTLVVLDVDGLQERFNVKDTHTLLLYSEYQVPWCEFVHTGQQNDLMKNYDVRHAPILLLLIATRYYQ